MGQAIIAPHTIAGIVKAEYIHVPVIGLADGIIDNLYAIDLKTE